MRLWLTLGLFLVAFVPAGAQPWQGFTALVPAPDTRTFATGGREGEVLWWESSTGEVLGRWTLGSGLPVVSLEFDLRSGTLTALALDGTPWTFDLSGGIFGPPVPGPTRGPQTKPRPPMVPAAAETTELSAEGTSDGRITVKSRADGRVLAAWQAHTAGITGLALAPDGTWLVSCSYDGGLARWDPRTGVLLGRL